MELFNDVIEDPVFFVLFDFTLRGEELEASTLLASKPLVSNMLSLDCVPRLVGFDSGSKRIELASLS